jgi:Xaa-Pro aminopeptidase
MKKAATARTSIDITEYADRRKRVLRALGGAVGIVFAGEGSPPLLGRWRPDSHFYYLTGIDSEPGAAVLFDPGAEDPDRRCILILRPLDSEQQRWDGHREEISSALRSRTGFRKVMRSTALPMLLGKAARRSKRLACLHTFAGHNSSVSPDLAVFRKVTERIPGVQIEDQTNLLPSLRAVKSKAEVTLMRHAARATALGYAAAAQIIRPGVTEMEIQHALENGYRANGASGPAYNSIVGAGFNGTVLHYMENADVARDGDLVVIDSGAEYQGYTCDVTRTFPVSGRFTKEQRELYNVVLRAQAAAIKAARPGARWHDVDGASRRVIENAGYGDAYIHGVGHQLGLEVHDASPDGPLKPGMVITIEPGVYFPDRNVGIRIEDDVLITSAGNTNLTAAIPKKPEDVESFMRD